VQQLHAAYLGLCYSSEGSKVMANSKIFANSPPPRSVSPSVSLRKVNARFSECSRVSCCPNRMSHTVTMAYIRQMTICVRPTMTFTEGQNRSRTCQQQARILCCTRHIASLADSKADAPWRVMWPHVLSKPKSEWPVQCACCHAARAYQAVYSTARCKEGQRAGSVEVHCGEATA
jgi:hypothetical protein